MEPYVNESAGWRFWLRRRWRYGRCDEVLVESPFKRRATLRCELAKWHGGPHTAKWRPKRGK